MPAKMNHCACTRLFRVVLHFACLPVQSSGRATTRSDDLIYVKDSFRGKLIYVDDPVCHTSISAPPYCT